MIEAQPPKEEKKPGIGKGKKVLIVDDDPGTIELIKSILEKQEFSVASATNGKQGLKVASQENPHIVIADVIMPEMDGFEFFKEIRKNKDTEHIPVLIVTVRKNMEDSFIALGAEAFITKPIDPQTLLTTLETLPIRPKKEKKTEEKPPADPKKEEKK